MTSVSDPSPDPDSRLALNKDLSGKQDPGQEPLFLMQSLRAASCRPLR